MVKDNSEILHLIKDRLNNKCNCGCSSLVKDLKRILTPKDCLPPTPYRFEEPHISFLVINNHLEIYVNITKDKNTFTKPYCTEIRLPFSMDIPSKLYNLVDTDLEEAPIILIIDLWQCDANYYIHIEEIERVCSKWGLERVTDL